MAKTTRLSAKKVSFPSKAKTVTKSPPTAKSFIEALKKLQSDKELEKIQRYFKSGEGQYGEGDQFMGVRMGQLFALAKVNIAMEPDEIEKLLESKIHEV